MLRLSTVTKVFMPVNMLRNRQFYTIFGYKMFDESLENLSMLSCSF
nr:MAG TPA: hypothetical protein [Caudoviricetes sp.]